MDNFKNILGFGVAAVEDEIGMAVGHLRPANLEPFQANLLDQPTGGIGVGVAEDTATTGEVVGLGLFAVLEVLIGEGHDFATATPGLKLERGPEDKAAIALQTGMAIAIVKILRVKNINPAIGV